MAISKTVTLTSAVVEDITLVPADVATVSVGRLRISGVSGTAVDLWVRWGEDISTLTDPVADGDNSIFVHSEDVDATSFEVNVPVATRAVKVLGVGTPKICVYLM